MIPVDEAKKKECADHESQSVDDEPKGDPEMAPLYLSRLLPVFCQTFQHTMIHSVRYEHCSLFQLGIALGRAMLYFGKPKRRCISSFAALFNFKDTVQKILIFLSNVKFRTSD